MVVVLVFMVVVLFVLIFVLMPVVLIVLFVLVFMLVLMLVVPVVLFVFMLMLVFVLLLFVQVRVCCQLFVLCGGALYALHPGGRSGDCLKVEEASVEQSGQIYLAPVALYDFCFWLQRANYALYLF